MMSQIIAPAHSYKNPRIYYQCYRIWEEIRKDSVDIFFDNFYSASQTSYDDSKLNLRSPFNLRTCFNFSFSFSLEICLENCLENLAVQPNHEKPGGPNFPTNKKIFLSSFEYNFLNKHVKHLDQQMGARHYLLGNKDLLAGFSNQTGATISAS